MLIPMGTCKEWPYCTNCVQECRVTYKTEEKQWPSELHLARRHPGCFCSDFWGWRPGWEQNEATTRGSQNPWLEMKSQGLSWCQGWAFLCGCDLELCAVVRLDFEKHEDNVWSSPYRMRGFWSFLRGREPSDSWTTVYKVRFGVPSYWGHCLCPLTPLTSGCVSSCLLRTSRLLCIGSGPVLH